jgi:hypothetical protein
MFEKHSPQNTTLPAVLWRLASSMVLGLTTLLLVGGCETKGMGRSCSLGQTITPEQGAYSLNATECQSRMCVKPPIQPGVSRELDTAAYCSATCSSDNDCDGQIRDRSNPDDKRCKGGYTCAIPFGAADDTVGGGGLCCQKICLCRDFFLASVGAATPETCQAGSDASCSSANLRD